ncbi:helix-turn-helix domain-containing protein [uncultured Streptococcus sp.]|uniref:helix-turn-helix domain-containing protein n=1 Tax=uncultured Streptococcus sp. TaxID=83427 RepID=UPI0025FDA821|nr:helix-turn-helix transcriptional regulator [uncultured Streptococcus sp.]
MGNKLKKLRKAKGLTLEQLKNELEQKQGVSFSTGQLSSYENGRRSPREESTWEPIANYFKVPVSYLLGFGPRTIGETMEILEAVSAGTIPQDDEIALKVLREQRRANRRVKRITQQTYEKYKDFDLVSNIKVFTLLLEHCDSIHTDITRYVSPRLVQNELTEKELKSLNTFINLLEEHGKEFKDTADSFSKRLNTKSETTPTNID